MALPHDYSEPMPKSLHPGSMTARQFAQAVKRSKASPMMAARARRVLVDGMAVLDVAISEGVRTPTNYYAIHKVCQI